MIVYNVALALLTMAYAGTNNSALGLDASRFDLNARSNHVETEDHPTLALVDCGHVPEESNDEGVDTAVKWTGLRGLINGVHIVSTEIGSNSADRTDQEAKIWIERSNRLVRAGHVPEESTADAGVDAAGLRSLINGVHANATPEIGSNNADGTVPAAKIWIERSKRLVARVS